MRSTKFVWLWVSVLTFAIVLPAGCRSGDVRRLKGEFTGFVFNESEAQANKTRRLMVIGDSWAQFLTSNHTFDHLLSEYGYPDYYAGSTALVGTTARQWARPSSLRVITGILRDRPETEIIVLTIGGNDLLESWDREMAPEAVAREFDRIAGHVRELVRALTDVRESVRVVILGYDYANLNESLEGTGSEINRRYYRRLREPSALEVNQALIHLSRRIKGVADETERVEYVNNLGLMQFVYGYERYGVAPNSVPFPGNHAENYEPFAAGRPDLSSPPEAMFQKVGFVDSIHLSAESYYYIGQNAMLRYIDPWLKVGN